jgi:hypothetical protein
MLRGAAWVSGGEISIDIPQELRSSPVDEDILYSWSENDSSVALLKNDDIVWQFNYNTVKGKPFFHPIYLNRNRLTCESPDDHPWHLGQWFSWKYINGINYWEYLGNGYNSEGITDITDMEIRKNPDFSASINLEILYKPDQGEALLKELRRIDISPPNSDLIRMDYEMTFESLADSLVLDRTPIEGEPDGKSWGGYAGLSIRFNQDLMESGWITEAGREMDVNGTTGDWLYMGFSGIDGSRVGSAMFKSEQTKRDGEAWYLISDPDLPFHYFSPAYLYLEPHVLQKGEIIHLNYRVMHIAGPVSSKFLKSEYQQYISSDHTIP